MSDASENGRITLENVYDPSGDRVVTTINLAGAGTEDMNAIEANSENTMNHCMAVAYLIRAGKAEDAQRIAERSSDIIMLPGNKTVKASDGITLEELGNIRAFAQNDIILERSKIGRAHV